MSLRTPDLLFTAIAPAIWGSTYIVTTQYLPNFSPMTVAMLRALPAGFIARDDRPTDSNGNLVDAHLHPRRT
ncbi:hypothetical protein [Klebsiella pneumoniae]|uniref:hypothetical protein n=1 Tax=Klebsiella pneumoniae TaxID=573 RepID=UPI0018EEF05E